VTQHSTKPTIEKSTTKDSPQSNENTGASTTPTSRPGLGNSILGKKKNDTSVESSHPDQHTKAPPAPARKPGLDDNMLERKRHKTTTDSSSNSHSTESSLAPTPRPGLGNDILGRESLSPVSEFCPFRYCLLVSKARAGRPM
jgi:hypothetical protein